MEHHHRGRQQFLVADGEAQLVRLRMLIRMGFVLAGVCTVFILYYMLISRRLVFAIQSPNLQQQGSGASSVGRVGSRVGGTQLYHIVFGIAASWRSWEARKANAQLWWRGSEMRGFVWMDELPLSRSQAWERTLSTHHPPLKLSRSFNRSAAPSGRVLGIVSEAVRLGLPDVHWFVVGGDETVFIPENLVHALAKYDHRKLYRFGNSSSSSGGGGWGVAISYGLARELESARDGCLRRNAGLEECTAELGVLSPREAGFNQVFGLPQAAAPVHGLPD